MNWDIVGAIGEWAGALAVVVTLFYLAKQIRENSQQVRMSSIVSINHLINEAFNPIYNNEKNVRVWAVGQHSPADLDKEEEMLFSLFMARLVNVLLTAFSQYRYDVLDNEDFERYVGVLKSLLDTPGGRHWLSNMGGAELLTDEAKNLLGGTIAPQPALALSLNEPGR
jgi:hypothetical protein